MARGEDRPLPPVVVVSADSSRIGCFEKRRRKKQAQKFYDNQSELILEFEKDDKLLLGQDEPEGSRGLDGTLNMICICMNVFILCANLTASILSGSLSIMGTFVDSAMDVTSSVIMGICMYLIKQARKRPEKYPRGRESLEMLGVILCSVIMCIAQLVVILQSIEAIHGDNIHPDMTLITFIILVSGCTLKFILTLICFKIGTPTCKVLAMDMRNDIATSVVAIVCAFLGDKFWKYADPIGAIVVCGLIAVSWFYHAIEHIPSMTGHGAEAEQLARILRIARDHDDKIMKIDHVMLYHVGEKCIVELHVVMNEELTLKVTHDICHPLEKKLNQLDFVARSFVHCDYNCDGDH